MAQDKYRTGQAEDSRELGEAYSNENVRASIADCDWFNTDYILEVTANESDPEFSWDKGFTDKQLAGFLQAPEGMKSVNGKSDLYQQLKNYVTERMVGSQGHPFPIGNILFADESFLELAKSLGANERYEVERGMVFEVDAYLMCLIAPKNMRRQVVKQCCRWGEGYDDRRRDVLLWAELVKRGAKQFFAENQPAGSEPAGNADLVK